MSSGRVPGPLGSGGNHSTIDDGTLQRSLSRVPGVTGAPTNALAEQSARPPLLPASRGGVKPPPTVQFGSRGPLIQRLQRLLNERLSPSPQLAINGNFDAATLAAVKQYQQHLRLNVDGRVGRDTWYRLHKGDIATVPGAPKPVEKIIALTKQSISAWTLEQKFSRVLELTPPKLPGHMREEFMKLLDPTALAIIVGTLIVWAASHAFGVGVIVDIAMLIGGVVFVGMAAIDAAGHLYDFLTLTATADEESDLDQASVMLAKAVAILGVGAFAALVTKGVAKRGAKKTAPPEQKPLMKDPGPKVARDEPNVDKESNKKDAPDKQKRNVAADREEVGRLVAKGDITGARAVMQKYVDDAKNAKSPAEAKVARANFVDCLDVSSPKDKAYFWSGYPDGFSEAKRLAQARGGVVLETTTGGKVINSQGADDLWAKDMNDAFGKELWDDVSSKYAKSATGEINTIQTASKLGDNSTVWARKELPALKMGQESGNVGAINIWKLENGSLGSGPIKTIAPGL